MVAKEQLKEKYIHYLIEELKLKEAYLAHIETIYIGGGTPSSLSLELLDKLFYTIKTMINMSQIQEYTIEVNPIDVTDEFCQLINQYRITRVSLGIQSINHEKLKIMNRNHDKKMVETALSYLKKHNIININADLIYGVNSETWLNLKHDLEFLIQHNVTHISAYSLILEEKTKLYHLFKKNEFTQMDESKEVKLYHQIVKYLKKHGFEHYELSNFAKLGYKSLHNQFYWKNCHYLGIGASASYYIDNIRYTNAKNLELYFLGVESKNLNYFEITQLTKKDQMKEEFILGLRMIEGVNMLTFQEKYGLNPFISFPFIQNLINQGVLEQKKDFIFIPESKLYVSNAILVYFV